MEASKNDDFTSIDLTAGVGNEVLQPTVADPVSCDQYDREKSQRIADEDRNHDGKQVRADLAHPIDRDDQKFYDG